MVSEINAYVRFWLAKIQKNWLEDGRSVKTPVFSIGFASERDISRRRRRLDPLFMQKRWVDRIEQGVVGSDSGLAWGFIDPGNFVDIRYEA